MNPELQRTRLTSLRRGYRTLAILALNTVLLLLLANLLAAGFLALERRLLAPPPGALSYGLERLARVYPGWEDEEIEALLEETWSRRYVYQPFVQHREAPQRGRYVNVTSDGFREVAVPGPWPPEEERLNLFVFGGSTTFGYGVADGDTIPSRLQEHLRAAGCGATPTVYNFGGGNFYSEQERALLGTLITAGFVPDAVVFIDGLNEWKREPKFTERIRYFLDESESQLRLRAVKSLPIVDAARRLRDRVRPLAQESPTRAEAASLAPEVARRWLASQRLIRGEAEELGIDAVFVWQPVPVHHYDLSSHLFLEDSPSALASYRTLAEGYRLFDRLRADDERLRPENGFLWLADLQQGVREPLYVDSTHYTAAFSNRIARRIAAFVAPRLGCGPAASAS